MNSFSSILRQRRPAIAIYITAGFLILLALSFLSYSQSYFSSSINSIHIKHTNDRHPSSHGDEVYMTLLCPPSSSQGGVDYYFEATRILTYRLLHKPSTRDLHNRPLIILATETVTSEQQHILESDGAIIHKVHSLPPPHGIDPAFINQQWKDQFTKLVMWNMTQFSKILYMDADLLPIRPMSAVFETPSAHNEDGEEYLFAATYDSAGVRDFGKFTRPIPNLGPSDTSAASEINAGLFLLQPSERQAAYVQSIYNDVSVSQHFTDMMEQGLLRYAYRDDGKYPWIRLSQMYNTQWPRLQDLDVSRAVHDKMWKDDSPVNWELRRFWYFAWGEMRGWASNREGGE